MKPMQALVVMAVASVFATIGVAQPVATPSNSFQVVDATGKVMGRAYPYSTSGIFAIPLSLAGTPAFVGVARHQLEPLPSLARVVFESSDCTGPGYVEGYANALSLVGVYRKGDGYHLYVADQSSGLVSVAASSQGDQVGGCTLLPEQMLSVYAVGAEGVLDVQPPFKLVPESAAPIAVVSRKTHGNAGTFDLPLAMTQANPTTEPRQGPAQTAVFKFDEPVTSGTASVTEGAAAAGTPTFSGNEMIVPLTGVPNQQYVTVTVSSVVSAAGVAGGSGSVRVGFLAGDVTGNRVVTLSDVLRVNAALAQTVGPSNFLRDVNANGTLTLSDKLLVNGNLTKLLPAP